MIIKNINLNLKTMKSQTPKTKRLPSAQKVQSKGTQSKKISSMKDRPSSTDSLAVYMRNSDSRSSWSGVANAAEKKYGKINVSNFDVTKKRKTNAAAANAKYNLKNK